MARKLAIIAIFLCSAAAWAILGASIVARTGEAGSELGPRVASTWGAPQSQTPPAATVKRTIQKPVENPAAGAPKSVAETIVESLPIEQSRIRVALELEQRQKGLLWFPTYRVDFRGDYLFRNTTPSDEVTIRLAFPVPEAIYDDLVLRVDGKPVPTTTVDGAVSTVVHRAPGSQIRVTTGYRSQGMKTWNYTFGLADHISIHLALAICSAVSIFLVVSYLRIVVNATFAWREAALAQFVYLVLFSYAFFFQGFTGLAITIGAIISLFVAMQVTARVDWGREAGV